MLFRSDENLLRVNDKPTNNINFLKSQYLIKNHNKVNDNNNKIIKLIKFN